MEGIIEIDSERGRQLGFTSDRFSHGSYLWDDGDRVMISAIVSSKARGNFKALVDAILAEGKAVAVPTPLRDMERIVRKNGYVHSIENADGEPVDVWTLKPGD
jgi:hypothetical protein